MVIISLISTSTAQDTIQLETGKIFDSIDFSLKKNYFSKELIEITKDSFLIEDCYYLRIDGDQLQRKSNLFSSYKIADSIIYIREYNYLSIWNFEKINDSLFYIKNSSEQGYAKSLVPLIKHGQFFTFNSNDTVILMNYKDNILQDYSFYDLEEIKDTIYNYNTVDTPPIYPGGEIALQKDLSLDYSILGMCQESQMQGKTYVGFVILKSGKITNIRILRSFDPLIDFEAIKLVSRLKDFTPGIIENQPVNVEYIVTVKRILY